MSNIRFVTGFTHGFIDYAGAFILVTVPVIANFQATSPVAFWLSIGAGLALSTYSLLTDYALSLKKLIPLKLHLFLDMFASVMFLIVPFLFGFEGLVKWFFLANGVLVLVAVILTDDRPVNRSVSLN
ncbi:hypothetical protein KR51_00018360 [Rubidibacter lacunae KORDI 51-2]|uniref:SPW repeat protein n=1 Tax=Rubidibacter lacunae KORDI 51-2 TaxID=582515 RepID=U5DM19_9CHRO|nr:hypothetical protein [Rubidibacter lacunae]ERN41614.1 hypothetical protein KR51_00018360 [Rubidibacter lacunae KORDI 51-2]